MNKSLAMTRKKFSPKKKSFCQDIKVFVEMWKFSLIVKKFNEENIKVLPMDENSTKKQKGFVERQMFNHEKI